MPSNATLNDGDDGVANESARDLLMKLEIDEVIVDTLVDELEFRTVGDLTRRLSMKDLFQSNMVESQRKLLWAHMEVLRGNVGQHCPPKGIVVQLVTKSIEVRKLLESNILDLEITQQFSKNLVSLLTQPTHTKINEMPLNGPPFRLNVVRNETQEKCSITTATLSVMEGSDNDAPFLEMRIQGLQEDGDVAKLPPDFRNTAPYNPKKIIVKVLHIEDDKHNNSLTELSSTNAEMCPSLHLFQVQLLGGTNKALPKIPTAVANLCINNIKSKLTLNESDAVFEKSAEFMRALRVTDFMHNVHQGMLLWGPAGGAKTTLARIIGSFGFVTAFNGNLVSLGTEYQNSASRGMRNLFEFCAHYNHLPHLLICDEIDRVVQKRDTASSKSSSKKGGGNESENTLSLFLEQFTSKKNVFVIGTTNKYHAIDEAAIRPGRMGLHVFVGRLAPKAAQAFLARLLQNRGYKTASDEIKRMGGTEDLLQKLHISIFNQTGASLEHAINATITLSDFLLTAKWSDMEPTFDKHIKGLRNPALEPSAIRLHSNKQQLELHGPINALQRAIGMNSTAADTIPILQSLMVIDSSSGIGLMPGNGHTLHLPFRLVRRARLEELLSEPGHFADALGVVVLGIHADFLEVVNQSNLPEEGDVAAYAYEKIKMGGAGLLVVGINVDSILGVKEDTSTAKSTGTNEGSEWNTSTQESNTMTAGEGKTQGRDVGGGKNFSKNQATTKGVNESSGTSAEGGLSNWLMPAPLASSSLSQQQGSHLDRTEGSTYGFDVHASWNTSTSKDKSTAIGTTKTTGTSKTMGISEQTTITTTHTLEDFAIFRRLKTLIEELQHAKNVVVTVISSRQDRYTLNALMSGLHIKPALMCRLCGIRSHDPSCLLLTLTPVPCCTFCFRHESPYMGITFFDDGKSERNVDEVLKGLAPVLPLVENVACCAVEGLWAKKPGAKTVQHKILNSIRQFPNLERILIWSFQDVKVSSSVWLVRQIPTHLLSDPHLAQHRLAVGDHTSNIEVDPISKGHV